MSFDVHLCAALAKWLRCELDARPATLVGRLTKRGVNAKAGQKWSYLQLDQELVLWVGKDFVDQTIALRPTTIWGKRGVQLLHLPLEVEETADAQVVREFVMSEGQLRRMDEIVADPETRTASHPYFPDQPIWIARYKSLSTAHPFVLTYDESHSILAARTLPRGHPTSLHPVIAVPGGPPIAYIFGGSLQHPAVNHLSGIALHVPVARAGNIYRITAGETAEGGPRFHRVCRYTGPQGVAVELEHGIPIAIYTNPWAPDPASRQSLLVKRRWPDRSPQACAPSYITARWFSMLPALFTGQVVKKEGVVWVQNRPLYVGHRLAGLPAETLAISTAQAERVGAQATFQVNVLGRADDRSESFGFTWQGRKVDAWPPEVLERIEQLQPVAQRRVLDQALWLPLTTEMLSRGWLLGDVGDLVQRVTDLGLGREARVVSHVEATIRVSRDSHESEADMVCRVKRELLEWLDGCGEYAAAHPSGICDSSSKIAKRFRSNT